ncbi:toll-like receptor 4 [Mytilus galloprovincialis]|uniref:toll-like receptor 4 n=1 Tax=Mytilus galloprovincialis TaxID=29158 RepID=UPI003F7BF709
MPYIERLDLSKCQINTISIGSFTILVHLKYLDLSDNRCLKFRGLANVTRELPSTSIEILRINKMHQTFDLNTIMTKCQVEPLRCTNLTEMQLAGNRLQIIESGALQYLPKTLKKISIADNEFSFGEYIKDVSDVTVEEVNASYMGLSHYLMDPDEICEHRQPGYSPCNESTDFYREFKIKRNIEDLHRQNAFLSLFGFVPIPMKLRKFHFRECKLRYYIPEMNFENNIVEFIDISFNAFYDWQGPITNLRYLTFLDISNNFCSKVSTEFFEYGTNLTTLLIQNNLLGFVLPKDINGKILAKVTKLKVLNLADNRIPSLPKAIFNSQTEIRILNLSGNMFENLIFKIDHMTKLSYLDLSDNRLSTLASSFTKQLDILSKNVPNLTVNLLGNPIKCTCESIQLIQWIASTNVHVLDMIKQNCQSHQINLNSSKLIYDILKKKCSSYTTTIVTVVSWLVIFGIVIIAGIAYRYRWKLRYAYYIVKGKHHGQIKPFRTDDDFVFDAFISYADDDGPFVYTKFLKHLEEDRNIRCCIHKRDFLAGNDIATNITSAIHNSRKTVIIMSQHFLESDWCLFEFNMAKMESIYARSKENIIMLVFLEQMSSKDLPLNILELVQSKSYIEYPNDEYGDVVFWDKLKEALSV